MNNKRTKKGKGRTRIKRRDEIGRVVYRVTAAHDPKVKTSSSKKKTIKQKIRRNLKKFFKQFLPKKIVPKKLQASSSNISSNTRRKKDETAIQKRLAHDFAVLQSQIPDFFGESSSNSFTRKHRTNKKRMQVVTIL
jgi:hypothetical protein